MVLSTMARKKIQTRRPRRPGNCGDVLWVKETFGLLADATPSAKKDPGVYALACGCFYRADYPGDDDIVTRWRPSIHMPRELCRLLLTITHTRPEPLQSITTSDVRAEGFHADSEGLAHLHFQAAWDSIYGAGEFAYKRNPAIWVTEFRIVTK